MNQKVSLNSHTGTTMKKIAEEYSGSWINLLKRVVFIFIYSEEHEEDRSL